jgi:hypothetical protein
VSTSPTSESPSTGDSDEVGSAAEAAGDGVTCRRDWRGAPPSKGSAPGAPTYTAVAVGAHRALILLNGLGYQRASWEIWSTFPQVSFSWAMVEPVTSVGGIVNSAPRALMRSYSALMSSLKNMAAG